MTSPAEFEANSLHLAFTKILSKHLAANKKVGFAFQQTSSIWCLS